MQRPCFQFDMPLRKGPPPWARYQPPWISCLQTPGCCGNKMRNKAQVLKYIKNSSCLTKKQQYAYVVNRPRWQYLMPASANANTYIPSHQCKKSTAPLRSPASASDVPGSAMLFFDKSVPITSYRTVRQYGTTPYYPHFQVNRRSTPGD